MFHICGGIYVGEVNSFNREEMMEICIVRKGSHTKKHAKNENLYCYKLDICLVLFGTYTHIHI